MVVIQSIADVRKALQPLGKVVGLGVTAFPRVGIVDLVANYEIVCIRESSDLDSLRQVVPVKSVKCDFKSKTGKLNTLALLKNRKVQEYLRSSGQRANLFLYRSSEQIERIVDRLELKTLSNRSEVRDVFEDKWEFRRAALKAGILLSRGEQMHIDDLTLDVFTRLQKELGRKLVFQITDYTKGGGIGTFFVSDKKGFEEFHGFVRRRRAAGRNLQRVNITKLIEGESASINACVTRHGVLVSRVQRQIVDVREVVGYCGRSGVFCGHDWGKRYSERIQSNAQKLTKRLGEYMYKKRYRGIFGIDLVVNRKTGEVAMVECNSRYTGAFPIYTMLQLKAGEVPIDAWHLLEHAGVDYDMDFEKVQKSYSKVKTGAQLILHNLERAWVVVRGEVKPGVYRFKALLNSNAAASNLRSDFRDSDSGSWDETNEIVESLNQNEVRFSSRVQSPSLRARMGVQGSSLGDSNTLYWVRGGFSLGDLRAENEFVLTDGVPYRNFKVRPGARIGRVIFKREVMGNKGNDLQPEIKRAMIELYKMYKLKKIKNKK